MSFHCIKVFDGVQKSCRDITHMNIISLKIRFKKHHKTVTYSAVHKVVYQQIQPHTRTYAKNRCQSECNAISGSQHRFLRVYLKSSIKRNGIQRTFLGTMNSLLAYTIT